MLDQLYNHPFEKDKGNPRALSKDRFANGCALALAVHCLLSLDTTHALRSCVWRELGRLAYGMFVACDLRLSNYLLAGGATSHARFCSGRCC